MKKTKQNQSVQKRALFFHPMAGTLHLSNFSSLWCEHTIPETSFVSRSLRWFVRLLTSGIGRGDIRRIFDHLPPRRLRKQRSIRSTGAYTCFDTGIPADIVSIMTHPTASVNERTV